MTTLKQFFDSDFRCARVNWIMEHSEGTCPAIAASICFDLDASVRYMAYFIPAATPLSIALKAIFESHVIQSADPRDAKLRPPLLGVATGFPGLPAEMDSRRTSYTRRVFLYIDQTINDSYRELILSNGRKLAFDIVIRDRPLAETRSSLETPLAFISHAHLDGKELARDLANELASHMCPTWYDEYQLRPGDNLRDSIEKGLRECRNCILVLSPQFILNKGWTKVEFESIFAREILEGKTLFLPILHGVSVDDAFRYSPILANRVMLDSVIGAKAMATKLQAVIKA